MSRGSILLFNSAKCSDSCSVCEYQLVFLFETDFCRMFCNVKMFESFCMDFINNKFVHNCEAELSGREN